MDVIQFLSKHYGDLDVENKTRNKMSDLLERTLFGYDWCGQDSASTTSASTTSGHSWGGNLDLQTILDAKAKIMALGPAPRMLQFIDDAHLTETTQTKFPKKKKNRRWAKKYQKKYTKTAPSEKVYLIKGGVAICHPVIVERIKDAIQQLTIKELKGEK